MTTMTHWAIRKFIINTCCKHDSILLFAYSIVLASEYYSLRSLINLSHCLTSNYLTAILPRGRMIHSWDLALVLSS